MSHLWWINNNQLQQCLQYLHLHCVCYYSANIHNIYIQNVLLFGQYLYSECVTIRRDKQWCTVAMHWSACWVMVSGAVAATSHLFPLQETVLFRLLCRGCSALSDFCCGRLSGWETTIEAGGGLRGELGQTCRADRVSLRQKIRPHHTSSAATSRTRCPSDLSNVQTSGRNHRSFGPSTGWSVLLNSFLYSSS